MAFCDVSAASSGSHNGGVCVREATALSIDLCAFGGCQHTSTENNAAAALLVYDCPPAGALVESMFIGNRPDGSYTITVTSGNMLHIRRCCFTGGRDKELNSMLVRVDACEFGAVRCSQIDVPSGGFDIRVTAQRATVDKTAQLEEKATPDVNVLASRKVEIVMAASTALSVLSAIVMTTTHIAVHRWWTTRKQPRAFQ
jgi:hypothetical protein